MLSRFKILRFAQNDSNKQYDKIYLGSLNELLSDTILLNTKASSFES